MGQKKRTTLHQNKYEENFDTELEDDEHNIKNNKSRPEIRKIAYIWSQVFCEEQCLM